MGKLNLYITDKTENLQLKNFILYYFVHMKEPLQNVVKEKQMNKC